LFILVKEGEFHEKDNSLLRILDTSESVFDVAPPLQWVDVGDYIKHHPCHYGWDPCNDALRLFPTRDKEPQLMPVVSIG
jgi:hypothetical protein